MASARAQLGISKNPLATGPTPSQTVTVSTKSAWTDRWTPQPFLRPLEAIVTVSPSISSARLVYTYGTVKRESADAYAQGNPLECLGYYVKIEIFAPVYQPGRRNPNPPLGIWIGQIVDDQRAPHGGAEVADKAGDQVLTALGLEHLLRGVPIDASVVLDRNLTGTLFVSEVKNVRTEFVFNQRQPGGGRSGNRGRAEGLDTPIFTTERWPANDWAVPDMLQYVLTQFVNAVRDPEAPQFKLGTVPVGFERIKPVYSPFGKTALEVFNELLDRRRGLGWYVDVGDADPVTNGEAGSTTHPFMEIHLFSASERLRTVGDGADAFVLPANPNKITRFYATEPRVADISIGESAVTRYATVRLIGAPVRVMFTVSYADGTLEPGWSYVGEEQNEEQNYLDGGVFTVPGYGGLSLTRRAEANDRIRRESEALRRVYRQHRVPADWNWKVGYSANGGGMYAVVPSPDKLPGPSRLVMDRPTSPDQTNANKRPLRTLPLLVGGDYTVSPPTFSEVTGEFVEALVICLVDAGGSLMYRDVTRLLDPRGQWPEIRVRMLEDGIGFELDVDGNHMPHDLALNDSYWPSTPAALAAAGTQPSLSLPRPQRSLDYNTLLATLSVDSDTRPVVELNLTGDENQATLTIEFPFYGFWYAAPHTVVGVHDSGDLKYIHSANRVLRDDMPTLRLIAAFIEDWYSQVRRTLDLTIRSYEYMPVGAMLMAVNVGARSMQMNTIITAVAWDFSRRTTRIQSAYEELDVARAFGGRRI